MKEEKKILRNYILYLLVGLLIIIYGMFHKIPITFALTNQNTIQFYDNNGSGANWVTTNYISQIQKSEATFTTQAGSYGGLVLAMLPTPVNINHTYSIYLSVGAESNGGFTELSSKNCIGLGNNYAQAIQSYVNCDYTPVYSRGSGNTGEYTRGLFWIFNSRQSASYIALPYTTQYTCTNCLQYSYGMEITDNGDYTLLDESELNNVINSQTNSIDTTINNMQSSITNSITQGNNSILQNSNSNRQAIIDNQNSNTQSILDSNKENFNTCRDSYNLFNKSTIIMGDVTNQNNTIRASSRQSLYLDVGTYTFKTNLDLSIYGISLQITSSAPPLNNYNYIRDFGYIGNQTYTFNVSTAGYFVMQIRKNGNLTFNLSDISSNKYMLVKGSSIFDFEDFGVEICVNKLDEQKDAINNLNDNITSDNVDDNDIANYFDDFNDFLDDNSTITQLITLPVTLYTAILNNLNGTCSPFNLGNLFGTNLILPCINISQYLGNSLWTMIDIIISGFAIYEIAKKFIKVFNNLSSLREGDVIDD